MSSNQTQGIIAAIIGLILILLGLESCSNSSELFPTTGCLSMVVGGILLLGSTGGLVTQSNPTPTQEEE